jgi:hypothetical protein
MASDEANLSVPFNQIEILNRPVRQNRAPGVYLKEWRSFSTTLIAAQVCAQKEASRWHHSHISPQLAAESYCRSS